LELLVLELLALVLELLVLSLLKIQLQGLKVLVRDLVPTLLVLKVVVASLDAA
jgi:hypothetical protein